MKIINKDRRNIFNLHMKAKNGEVTAYDATQIKGRTDTNLPGGK